MKTDHERILELENALGAVFDLAAVSFEGDPWFADQAGLDGNEILAQGREALRMPVPVPDTSGGRNDV